MVRIRVIWRAAAIAGFFALSGGCGNKGDASKPNPSGSAPAAAASAAATRTASEHGTPAEAQAMLDKAVAHFKDTPRKQALADFNGKKPPFFDRDLYVVCIGKNRIITANGGFPQYVGTSADALKDADGKPLGKAILDAGKDKTHAGSVHYRWVDPVTGKIEPKVSFARDAGEDVCCVGAYSP